MRLVFAIPLVAALVGGCDGCRARPGPDPAAAAASTLKEGEALASAVADDDAGTLCARAHREIGRLRGLLDAGAPPDEGSFLAGCEALPREVQACLRPSHAAARADACAALVEGLPEPERTRARDLARLR